MFVTHTHTPQGKKKRKKKKTRENSSGEEKSPWGDFDHNRAPYRDAPDLPVKYMLLLGQLCHPHLYQCSLREKSSFRARRWDYRGCLRVRPVSWLTVQNIPPWFATPIILLSCINFNTLVTVTSLRFRLMHFKQILKNIIRWIFITINQLAFLW